MKGNVFCHNICLNTVCSEIAYILLAYFTVKTNFVRQFMFTYGDKMYYIRPNNVYITMSYLLIRL